MLSVFVCVGRDWSPPRDRGLLWLQAEVRISGCLLGNKFPVCSLNSVCCLYYLHYLLADSFLLYLQPIQFPQGEILPVMAPGPAILGGIIWTYPEVCLHICAALYVQGRCVQEISVPR